MNILYDFCVEGVDVQCVEQSLLDERVARFTRVELAVCCSVNCKVQFLIGDWLYFFFASTLPTSRDTPPTHRR